MTSMRRHLPPSSLASGVAIAFALLAGCASQAPAPAAADAPVQLAGSAWQLVEFSVAGEGAATLRPQAADQYALRFGTDGMVAAKLDCNRGSGSWSAEPAGAGGGSLQIGALTSTRMMCPPSPLNQRLPRDIESVRRYRIVDGRLRMELAAGAGTYTWERVQP